MVLTLAERPVEIERVDPALRSQRRVTAFRAMVAVLTLHLVVDAARADSNAAGTLLAIALLLAAGLASVLVHDDGVVAVRVLLCAGLGTIGVAHTVGVSLNRVTRVGFGWRDVLFAPALLASVGLLVLAVTRAVSRRTWRAKALAVPCAIACVYYVVAPVTLGVWATHRVAEAPTGRSPADVGLTYEELRLEAADGSALAAWYVPSRNGAAVIVRHGASSSREAVLDHVAVLAGAGYGVLAMDARGHGRSEGEPNAFGWFADDVSVGVDHLLGRADVEAGRIGVLGLSMGGEEAITAAAADTRIEAVVAEGATMRSTEDFLALDKGLAMWISTPHYWVMYSTADLLSHAAPPPALRDAVADIAPRPVLIIAAGAVPEEVTLGEAFAAEAPATTALWIVPESEHTGGLRTSPKEWTERVLGVFDDALTSDEGSER